MAPLTSDYPRANAEIARLIRRDPSLMGYVFVNTESEKGRIAERVGNAVTRHGFCGIKVHAHDARVTREVGEVARRLGVPVLYDPAGDLASVEMVASAYADVGWVIPHLSSFADEWKAQCAFIDQLCRHPNVYALPLDAAGRTAVLGGNVLRLTRHGRGRFRARRARRGRSVKSTESPLPEGGRWP